MLGEMSAALSSLQAAADIGKAMVGLRDTAMIQTKIIDFQQAIITAQTSAIAANTAHAQQVERIRALEAELAGLKAWEAEKQRYELKDLGQGVLAYALKPDAQPTELQHSICPDCYQAAEKSILQQVTRQPGMIEVQLCQRCGWEGLTSGVWRPEHGSNKSSARRSR